MSRLLRFLHVVSGAVLIGALASSLLVAALGDARTPAELGAVRRALALLDNGLMLPALLLTITFGALLLVGRPHLIEARWVRVKAVLATVALLIATFAVLPATNLAAALSGVSIGAPSFAELAAALRTDAIGSLALLVLALVAAALGIWRPRLGAPPPER